MVKARISVSVQHPAELAAINVAAAPRGHRPSIGNMSLLQVVAAGTLFRSGRCPPGKIDVSSSSYNRIVQAYLRFPSKHSRLHLTTAKMSGLPSYKGRTVTLNTGAKIPYVPHHSMNTDRD